MPKKQSKETSYTVIFTPAEGGGYLITCPAIPGLTNVAPTLEEARKVARADVEAYLRVLAREGLGPPERGVIVETIRVREKGRAADRSGRGRSRRPTS